MNRDMIAWIFTLVCALGCGFAVIVAYDNGDFKTAIFFAIAFGSGLRELGDWRRK